MASQRISLRLALIYPGIIATGIALVSCDKKETPGNDNAAPPTSTVESSSKSIALNERPQDPRVDLIETAKRRAQQEALFESYKCRTDKCESEPLGAGSPIEAAWLQSRGFPTAEREAELDDMSLGELQLAADKNDLAAQAILGRKMWDQGNRVGGREQLFTAAANGSVYADYQLSKAEAAAHSLDSAAYLRRAYLQGDAKAALELYKAYPNLNAIEWNDVDQRAMGLYRALLASRANKGRMQFGPRP